MDLFSANGGTNIGAMIEAAKNTLWEDKVQELISKVTAPKNNLFTPDYTMKKWDTYDIINKIVKYYR